MSGIRLTCFACICLFSRMLPADAQTFPADSVFTIVDTPPQFQGGAEALTAFVVNNISKGVKNKIKNNKGASYRPRLTSFIVEKDGTMSDLHVRTDSLDLFENEVYRLLRKMPKWTPGIFSGQPVRSKITLPISFYLGTSSQGVRRLEYVGSGNTCFSLTYLKPFFSGNIGKNLRSNIGLTLEVKEVMNTVYINKYPKIYSSGLGLYYTWISARVINQFERRNTIWETGRYSSLNEIGVQWNSQFFPSRHFELGYSVQAGPLWHRATKKYPDDSGLGIGTVGASLGAGVNLFWYFNTTPNKNYHVITFKLGAQQLFMASPLSGNIWSIGIGYVFHLT